MTGKNRGQAMKTRVAVGQMTSTDDKAKNLSHVEDLIRRAALAKSHLVSLPENFAFLGKGEDRAIEAAEPLDGPSISQLRDCAKRHSIFVSLGGFQERSHNSKQIFNTHLVIDPAGSIIAKYRKIHLFSVTLPDGSTYNEAKSVLAGSDSVCFKTPCFTGGLAICYDLRFPYLFATLRDLGAEVLLVPAAFTKLTGEAHWEVLLRARAIETQSYVAASAQVGRHNEVRETFGHAMIVDPWGEVLAECSDSEDLATAEIDLTYLNKLRTEMPLWSQRRPDINDNAR